MESIGACRVVGVSCQNPDMVDLHTVGGPMQTIVTGPALLDVEVEIPVADLAEHRRLSEIYSKGEDVELAGHPFRITAFAWRKTPDEEAQLELTLRGRAPLEQISGIMVQIGQGPSAVSFHTSPGAKALQEAGEKEMAKRVPENRSLGTLDDLT